MPVGGIVVRVKPGQNDQLRRRLEGVPGVEIATETEEGFAVVLEGETASEQHERHERIASFPEVTEALVAFQSVEESE
jgi:nitrate reductase NapAB chaperone NapD